MTTRDPATGRFVRAPVIEYERGMTLEPGKTYSLPVGALLVQFCPHCSKRLSDPSFHLCAQCDAAAAAETMGDYDTHTIAPDPFHDPAPSWVGRVWRRVLQTLGW